MLQAMDRLVNTLGKSVELHLVGSGKSKAYLEELIQRYELTDLVFMYDDKDRSWIYPNLKNFDILIQPSRYEGFGLTIVEGMAAGLPVIASNLDGPKEILCNGRFGYLFESEDYCGLADKIVEVIDKYKNGTIGLQIARAYQHGTQYFSLPNMVNNYREVYQQMASWQTERKIAVL
jgi:glycosyltransferase involved in cell wall biosynthesis